MRGGSGGLRKKRTYGPGLRCSSAFVPAVLAPRVPGRAHALAGHGAEKAHGQGLLRDVPDARVVSLARGRFFDSPGRFKSESFVRVRGGDVWRLFRTLQEDVDETLERNGFEYGFETSPRRRRLGRLGRARVRGHAPARSAVSAPDREAKGAAAEPGQLRLELGLERVVLLRVRLLVG